MAPICLVILLAEHIPESVAESEAAYHVEDEIHRVTDAEEIVLKQTTSLNVDQGSKIAEFFANR